MVAGFIDAVVGGGGLVLIPALLIGLPQLPPASVLGTNKVAAVSGTVVAAITYVRRIALPRGRVAVAVVAAFAAACLGAWFASSTDPAVMRPGIIVAVLAVGIYVALRPAFGQGQSRPPRTGRWQMLALLAVAVIGFYDGIFGPGTGMFLIISLTSLLGVSFLQSAAAAKVINVATNAGSLLIFAIGGHIYLFLGLILAAGNIGGSYLGSVLVLKKGAGLVRIALLILVVALTTKLLLDECGIHL